MKPKVYLETTIPSYLVGRSSRDLLVAAHQEITREWWELRRAAFDIYVSELVIQEVLAGDPQLANQRMEILVDVPVLASTSEVLELAEDLIQNGPLPRKAAVDAAHIAMATVYGCDYLVTWNCRPHCKMLNYTERCAASPIDMVTTSRPCVHPKN